MSGIRFVLSFNQLLLYEYLLHIGCSVTRAEVKIYKRRKFKEKKYARNHANGHTINQVLRKKYKKKRYQPREKNKFKKKEMH